MATIPTVPGPFTDDTAPTLAQLGQLAQAVSFISDCTTRPTWHLYQTTPLSMSASTWNVTTQPAHPYLVAYDNDKVSTGYVASIVTQGYYAVEACFDLAKNNTTFTAVGAFLWTAGANNPHFTNGTTLRFGARGGATVSDGLADSAWCITDICPNVCYPGDTIQPQLWVSIASTMKVNTNDSYNTGRFVANFTGMWVSEGT